MGEGAVERRRGEVGAVGRRRAAAFRQRRGLVKLVDGAKATGAVPPLWNGGQSRGAEIEAHKAELDAYPDDESVRAQDDENARRKRRFNAAPRVESGAGPL